MLPTIEAFMAAHQLADVTIVADAGMISEANKRAIEAAGLSFILGTRIPDIPYAVTEWRRKHPDEQMPDGLILTQPRPAGSSWRAFGACHHSRPPSTGLLRGGQPSTGGGPTSSWKARTRASVALLATFAPAITAARSIALAVHNVRSNSR
jgi:hypothetical protein